MASPKIGRPKQQPLIDLSPAEEAARVAAGIALDAPLTENEIAAREVEKAALVGPTRTEQEPETPAITAVQTSEPASAIVARFAARQQEVTDARRAERRAEAAAFIGDLVSRAHGILTAHGSLVKKYMAKVSEAYRLDHDALRASVPLGLEFDEKSQRSVPRNHNLLHRYKAITERAYANLTSTFGSTNQGRDLDPAGLALAAQMVEQILVSGQTHYKDALLGADAWTDVINGNLKRGKSHLEYWVSRGQTILDSTREAVALFDKIESEVAALLARVGTPGEVPPREEPVTLPALQDPPVPYQGSSFTDFEVRSSMRGSAPQDDVKVSVVGDGDGYRVKSGGGR